MKRREKKRARRSADRRWGERARDYYTIGGWRRPSLPNKKVLLAKATSKPHSLVSHRIWGFNLIGKSTLHTASPAAPRVLRSPSPPVSKISTGTRPTFLPFINDKVQWLENKVQVISLATLLTKELVLTSKTQVIIPQYNYAKNTNPTFLAL